MVPRVIVVLQSYPSCVSYDGMTDRRIDEVEDPRRATRRAERPRPPGEVRNDALDSQAAPLVGKRVQDSLTRWLDQSNLVNTLLQQGNEQ